MDKQAVVSGLRGLADELEPFINEIRPGMRIWNGQTWAVTNETRERDPYALAWWSDLDCAADLLELQESPISEAQRSYLRNKIFGGMGSFADFFIDTKRYGEEGRAANENLDLKRTHLFRLFDNLT